MKIVGRIICSLLLVLCSLVSFVFVFIELRSLFAGDFLLFNNPVLAALTYLFRALFFLSLVAFSIFLMVIYLKKKEMHYIYYLLAASLTFGSFFSLFFYTNYIGLLVIFLAIVPTSTTLLRRLFIKKDN